MKKEEIRKEFFKLKLKCFSYSQCRRIIKARFDYDTTIRTLKRWSKKLNEGNWNLQDKSTKPNTIHKKVTAKLENEILILRRQTGWGSDKILANKPELNSLARNPQHLVFGDEWRNSYSNTLI